VQDNIIDKMDIDILRVLIHDTRSSYRSIGLSIGLSTNATKTRINRLISAGVIRRFLTTINVAAFGYSKLCYLFIRDNKTIQETLSRIKLVGQLVLQVNAIGGMSLFAIAVKKTEEQKIQLLAEALKPALIQNVFIGQSSPLKLKLTKTDFKIMKCLLLNARMEISEIANRISVSSKTVGIRLSKMKENRIVTFIVATDPLRMKGYIRFGMLISIDKQTPRKTIRQVQEELEEHFVIAVPMIQQEDIMNFQLVGSSIFEIDPARKKIESFDGIKRVEVFIPHRGGMQQDWIMREIDSRLNSDDKEKNLNV
jgi:DNA-binding Lrp family transcriptional regulator